jgi:DNA-nicking Smr family endonuclease
MKKNKSSEQPPADFKNNPFKSLKGVAPLPPSGAKQHVPSPMRTRTAAGDEDESSLFLRAAEGAKPLHRPPGGTAKNPAPEKTDQSAPEDNQLFLSAMQKIGATFRDTLSEQEVPEGGRRSPTSRMKQLKRGTLRIGQELDLHGFLRDEALTRLAHFIADASSSGQQAVLVITGKGINSPEGPVLQGAVAEWLRSKGRGVVAEFAPAPRDLGGSGAFVVFLKKK